MGEGKDRPRGPCDAERVPRAEAERELRQLGFTAQEATELLHELQKIEPCCRQLER